MFVNMKTMLWDAQDGGYAVGAFNIVNWLTARAVIDEASVLESPVILQTSQSTVRQIGAKQLVDIVRPMAEDAPVPVALHLDHGSDTELAKACIDAGYTSVMIDMSKKPIDENIETCATIARYAHAADVTVEGEIGAIVGVEDHISVDAREAALADPESAARFVSESGIDFLAPAVGTAHGLYKGTPKIEFELFSEIRRKVPVPMVIHGGTGLSDDTFRQLVSLGAAKINISTALKLAYCETIRQYLAGTETGNPLKQDYVAYQAVREMAARHIRLFGGEGRAKA